MFERPLIEVRQLVAGYGGPVVGPVSFSVMPGEIVGLSGANGTGKSTLLAAVTGMARVLAGEIVLRPGLRVSHHRQLAVRPDDLPVQAHEVARLAGADPDAAPGWLKQLMDRPVDELSGGQYQYLQAWICLAGPADLVLLDEPSNNLDGRGIEGLHGLLRALDPARAVILVSHEAEFLKSACTRIIEVPA